MAGMLAGVAAALLAYLFARLALEPRVELAIAFEAARDAAHGMAAEPELVSRATQRGLGLLTGLLAYGTAMGGGVALLFATLHGRLLRGDIRRDAIGLALAGFVVLVLTPALKYPPNPPAVGEPDTIQLRTALFFAMMAASVAAAVAGTLVARLVAARTDRLDAALAGGLAYLLLVALVALALPAVDEVPRAFPASLLWQFRLGSLAMQALLWAAIGLLFGRLADRELGGAR